MSLTILTRPNKDLYVNNPPETYEEAYYTSNWNAGGGRLPIQYEIESDLFPVNEVDDVDSICQVTDYNGYARITLCGTYETYLELEYIKISGSSNSNYNGIHQIINKLGPVDFIINVAYDTTATGSFQRYYNNYQVKVNVYSGLPAAHLLQSQKPIELIATLNLTPDSDNISRVSVAGLVKDKINNDIDLSSSNYPNDLNNYTAFYISYAESYDVSDGSNVTNTTTAYTVDEYETCPEEIITNGNFTSNLDGWTQIGSGTTWVQSAGTALAVKGANNGSKSMQQSVTILQSIPFDFELDWTNNQAGSQFMITVYAVISGVGVSFPIYQNILMGASGTISFEDYQFPYDMSAIGFKIDVFGGSAAKEIAVDRISLSPTDCTLYLWSLNAARQFRSRYGGNMGEYVINYNQEQFDNKFITVFDRPRMFVNHYFDLSALIPGDVFDNAPDNIIYCEVIEYDSTNTELARQIITISDKSDGLYLIKLSDLTYDSNTTYITTQLYRLPNNILLAGDSGTFDDTADPFSDPPNDWNIDNGDVGAIIYDTANPYEGIGDMFISVSGIDFDQGEYSVFSTNNNILVNSSRVYVVKAFVRLSDIDPLLINKGRVGFFIVDEFAEPITIINRVDREFDATTGGYQEISLTFLTNATATYINVYGVMYLDETTAAEYAEFNFDSMTLKGPIDYLSEAKNILLDRSCSRTHVQLRWKNELGGWDNWKFTADKNYETTIEDAREYTKDIFSNWDDTFINGQSADEWLDIEAYWTVKVRSQYLTLDEVKAIAGDRTSGTAGIIGSIKVYDISDVDSIIPVRVEKKSIKVRNDGDKLYTVEFEIRYPRIEIQNQ